MPFPNKKYQIIYADPPWEMGKIGLVGRDTRPGRVASPTRSVPTPYPTMQTGDIMVLPVGSICDTPCHLWLWVTNKRVHDAFHVMEAWGFKYLNIITFNKPSGVGAWFVNTTQHLIFGYRGKLTMGSGRYARTTQYYTPSKHSKKPDWVYDLIESISPYDRRIELFARQRVLGWDAWGNEIDNVN